MNMPSGLPDPTKKSARIPVVTNAATSSTPRIGPLTGAGPLRQRDRAQICPSILPHPAADGRRRITIPPFLYRRPQAQHTAAARTTIMSNTTLSCPAPFLAAADYPATGGC